MSLDTLKTRHGEFRVACESRGQVVVASLKAPRDGQAFRLTRNSLEGPGPSTWRLSATGTSEKDAVAKLKKLVNEHHSVEVLNP